MNHHPTNSFLIFWLYFPKIKGYLKLIFSNFQIRLWSSHFMAWILHIQFPCVLKQTNACSVRLIFGENGTDGCSWGCDGPSGVPFLQSMSCIEIALFYFNQILSGNRPKRKRARKILHTGPLSCHLPIIWATCLSQTMVRKMSDYHNC